MNDQPDSSNERLEGLLRRWGADQAAREANVPPAPAPQGPRARAPRGLTWGLLAAAAAMLVAAAGLYWLYQDARGEIDQLRDVLAAKHQQAGGLSAQLSGARGELGRTRRLLEQAQTRLAEEAKQFLAAKSRLGQLDEQSQARQKELADAKLERDALSKTLTAKQAELTKLTRAVAAGGQTKAALVAAEEKAKRLEADLTGTKKRLTAASAEIVRATRRADDASASRQKAEDELAALKLRQRGLMNSFQRLYLSSAEAPARASGAEPAAAAAPGDGLLTRQLTARRNQMLLRHAHLRPSLQTQAAKDLFETLEVLLIRLDVLAAQDARAAESFAALVRQSKLPERIDEVLAAAAESPEVRSWLMEARLILTGADRVG